MYIEPKVNPGAHVREVFLTLKEFEPTLSRGGDMPQNFLSPSVKVKEFEEQGESAMKASLAKGMRIRLGLDLRSADTLEVQLICNCCGQPYYPDKAWKGRLRAIVVLCIGSILGSLRYWFSMTRNIIEELLELRIVLPYPCIHHLHQVVLEQVFICRLDHDNCLPCLLPSVIDLKVTVFAESSPRHAASFRQVPQVRRFWDPNSLCSALTKS